MDTSGYSPSEHMGCDCGYDVVRFLVRVYGPVVLAGRCRCVRSFAVSCGRNSPVKPAPSLHIVGHVGQRDRGFGTGDADGANEQAHPVLLFGKDGRGSLIWPHWPGRRRVALVCLAGLVEKAPIGR